MKVVALCIFSDYTYLIAIQQKLFNSVWGNKVDKFVMVFNDVNKNVSDIVKNNSKIDKVYMKKYQHHSSALDVGYKYILDNYPKCKFVLIFDSDYFIFNPEAIDVLLDKIKGKKIVGQYAYNFQPKDILNEFTKKAGFARIQPFCFLMRQGSLKYKRSFSVGIIKKGTYINDWGITDRDIAFDTFGVLSRLNFTKETAYNMEVVNWIGHGHHIGSISRRYKMVLHPTLIGKPALIDYKEEELMLAYVPYLLGCNLVPKLWNDYFTKIMEQRVKEKGFDMDRIKNSAITYINKNLKDLYDIR